MDRSTREILDTAVDLRGRADALRKVAAHLETEAEGLERSVPGAAVEYEILRGSAITDRLLELTDPGEEFHYRGLNDLLQASGYVCSGKVPSNTLLTALIRSSDFASVRPRSGLFRRCLSTNEGGPSE